MSRLPWPTRARSSPRSKMEAAPVQDTAPRETRSSILRSELNRAREDACGPHCGCTGKPRGFSFGDATRASMTRLYAGQGGLTSYSTGKLDQFGKADAPGPGKYASIDGFAGKACSMKKVTRTDRARTDHDETRASELRKHHNENRTYTGDETIRLRRQALDRKTQKPDRPPPTSRPSSRGSDSDGDKAEKATTRPGRGRKSSVDSTRPTGSAASTSFKDELARLRKQVDTRAGQLEKEEREWRRGRRLRERRLMEYHCGCCCGPCGGGCGWY